MEVQCICIRPITIRDECCSRHSATGNGRRWRFILVYKTLRPYITEATFNLSVPLSLSLPPATAIICVECFLVILLSRHFLVCQSYAINGVTWRSTCYCESVLVVIRFFLVAAVKWMNTATGVWQEKYIGHVRAYFTAEARREAAAQLVVGGRRQKSID